MNRNGSIRYWDPLFRPVHLPVTIRLFLRMEDSERWPDVFRSIDLGLQHVVGMSRLVQHPDMVDRINAVRAYELSGEEKERISTCVDSFIRDWFDSYGYMDGVVVDENGADSDSGGAVLISEKV